MNAGVPWPTPQQAAARVLEIQTKLHRWAGEDPARRFDDLFNLVTDPAFLLVAWDRVRGNTGARSAGIDGTTAYEIEHGAGVEVFLRRIRDDLKAGAFRPVPVRERMIPKTGGKLRRLGIPTVRDRVVQAAVKLVLEPIFEAGFRSCSYGFRPNRSAHDAIAEIQLLATHRYEWVLEGDIEACFDSIDHTALMARVRRRVGDRRLVRLVKAFCKAGILTELGVQEQTTSGTPQGGILSPLLANIALSVLDDVAAETWQGQMATYTQRRRRWQQGLATWRLVRYADDFVIVVAGTRAHAEALREHVARVLARVGLRLSAAKTTIVHIDEGFDFLGFRIQRHPKRGTSKRHVYTYPSKKAVKTVIGKVRALLRGSNGLPLRVLLIRVSALLRGWCNYFRHGVSKRTFVYVANYTWYRMANWLRRRHNGLSWKALRRRLNNGWTIAEGGIELFDVSKVPVSRYRYRGNSIPTPWTPAHPAQPSA